MQLNAKNSEILSNNNNSEAFHKENTFDYHTSEIQCHKMNFDLKMLFLFIDFYL